MNSLYNVSMLRLYCTGVVMCCVVVVHGCWEIGPIFVKGEMKTYRISMRERIDLIPSSKFSNLEGRRCIVVSMMVLKKPDWDMFDVIVVLWGVLGWFVVVGLCR